jgi:glycosyltransferase involved in cell wall biosynthesis
MDYEQRQPELSVVIPVRNAALELPEQLEALARQTFQGIWETVVVDNGSTDHSAAIARSFGDRLPGLKVVPAADMSGQAYALNVGAARAAGRSLLFLDADDRVEPGYLEHMAGSLRNHPFVAGRLDCDSLNPPWLRRSRPPTQTDELGSPFGYLPSAAGCSIGVRRDIFEAVKGFDPSIQLGNDVDFCWRVQRLPTPLVFVPEAVVAYRYRQTVRAIFRQARTYGNAGPTLYRRYRGDGMPRRPWRRAVRFHAAALVRLARVRSKADVAALAFLLGFRFGIFEGCVRSHVVYL